MRWDVRNDDGGLRHMCDYGAEQVAKGQLDGLLFHIMAREVDALKAYMRVAHPNIKFGYDFPSWPETVAQTVAKEAGK